MIKISIITATFNSEKTIGRALESLNQQSYQCIEHIVIDGNSTDKTLEITQQTSKFLSTLISEPDKGIYDALNKGIQAATGDWVGFLHSDDELHSPHVIADIVQAIEEDKLEAIYGDLRYLSQHSNKVIRYWKSGSFTPDKLKHGWMPPHPSFYMKRDLYQKHGSFDLAFRIAADYDSLLRYLSLPNIKVGYLPKVIVDMRLGGASNKSLKNILQKSKEDYQALKKNDFLALYSLIMKNLRKLPQFFIK